MPKQSTWQQILSELQAGEVEVTTSQLELVNHANRVFVAGSGRSGLNLKSFAMRLSQLGKTAFVVGETTTPAFQKGDLLIVATGSGQTPQIINFMKKVIELNGQTWLLTATPETPATQLATEITYLAGKGKYANNAQSIQPMGSLFEQSLLIFGDAFTLSYMSKFEISELVMQQTHANLE
ncbi:6-phospho-3-hexuloisomerase [Holzapfeliella sp. JNUCC 80]